MREIVVKIQRFSSERCLTFPAFKTGRMVTAIIRSQVLLIRIKLHRYKGQSKRHILARKQFRNSFCNISFFSLRRNQQMPKHYHIHHNRNALRAKYDYPILDISMHFYFKKLPDFLTASFTISNIHGNWSCKILVSGFHFGAAKWDLFWLFVGEYILRGRGTGDDHIRSRRGVRME